MNRRTFNFALTASSLAGLCAVQISGAGAAEEPQGQPQSSRPTEVGMLMYPGLTLLDLIGPQTVLSHSSNIHLLWTSLDPIVTDTGIAIAPNMTLRDCPEELDVLFIPGGAGMIGVMGDPKVLDFVRSRGEKATYVTSDCSGSIVLGAAGLLRGYKATSHWAAKPSLPLFGAQIADGRVVVDHNRITGGGVTAGIDFGLTLLAQLRGQKAAEFAQLAMEYNPQPPFHTGSPQDAGQALTAQVFQSFEPLRAQTQRIAAKFAAGQLG